MFERILKVLTELNISGYRVEEISNGKITQVAIDKIKNGKTENPRKSTLEILTNILCEHYSVSREWIISGEGAQFLKKEEDTLFLEKHGVRFEGIELVDHFVQNKDEYFERSEYLKLFVNDLVEKGVTKRLNELKEYIQAINPRPQS
jgi:transcriptional regulator with XRE-family HTH domain